MNLLAVLEQNASVSWSDFLGNVEIRIEANPDLAPLPDELGEDDTTPAPSTPAVSQPTGDDDLATFKL